MFKLEKVRAEDIVSVKEIEIECHLSSWSEGDYRLETERDDSLFFIARVDSKPVGFIIGRLLKDVRSVLEDGEIEIYNIGVKSEYRKSGVGSGLLKEIFKVGALKNVERIFLEVRRSNGAAQNFYKKHSFRTIGERKNFYKNPEEDAILMCRFLRSV